MTMIKKLLTLSAIFVPTVTWAACATTDVGSFKCFVATIITKIVTPVTQVIFALAVTYFMWNITNLIRKSDQSEEREKLKDRVLWGVVAMAIMLSFWGLSYVVVNTFGWTDNASPTTIQVIGLP